jgi:hypothetical protein
VLLLTAPPAAGAGTRELDSDGLWTLSRLGAGRVILRAPGEVQAARFRLPSGAKQGDGRWYLLRLRFALTFAADTPEGIAYVSASTNGRAAAQIKARALPGAVEWSSVGLIDGRVERRTRGRRIEVDFRNYLQLSGVRPGLNTLSVRLERVGPVRVERLEVFPDSGIERTRLAPARVELRPRLPDGAVRVGDEFELGYALRNTGDRPARNVVVGIELPRGALAVLGPRVERFPELAGTAAGSFRLRALARGRFRIALTARSSANRPAALIDVPVGARESGRFGLVPLVLGGALLVAGVLLLRAR